MLPASGGVELSLFGAGVGVSGFFGAAPLFVSGEGRNQTLPLFLQGAASAPIGSGLNLAVSGHVGGLSAATPLFLLNSQSGVTQALPLVITAPGSTSGGLAIGSGLNLFLRRAPSEAMSLYLRGPGEQLSDGIPL